MDEQAMVYVVDDDPDIRQGIADIVESMQLQVRTFACAEDFVAHYDGERPGCVVLDVRMPGMSGLELQSLLCDGRHHLPVVIISGHGDIPIAVRSMQMGAVDFIEKPFREQVLWDAIRKAVDQDIETREEKRALGTFQAGLDLLTDRERGVAGFLVAGKRDKEVAADLGISQRAVAFHRAHILQKTGLRSIVELAGLLGRWQIDINPS